MLSRIEPDLDNEGNTRPRGSNYDLGAYESAYSSSTCDCTVNPGDDINSCSGITAGQTACFNPGTYSGTLLPANSGIAGRR